MSTDATPMSTDATLEPSVRRRATRSAADPDEEIRVLRHSLAQAQHAQGELRETLERLLEPPFHPATLIRVVDLASGPLAMIASGGQRRLVRLGPAVDAAGLAAGQDVLLDPERRLLVEKAPHGLSSVGETAIFERWLADGRIVVRLRDEEWLADASATLDRELASGDRVRFDRGTGMAFEAVPSEPRRCFLPEGLDGLDRSQLGGQDEEFELLRDSLAAALADPEMAARYGVGGRHVLMVGPPGCGKTRMARIAAAELQRVTGRPVHFEVVKPGEFESSWVGETEKNIRRRFADLRAAANGGLSVLFLDELDAFGRTRGSRAGQHADRSLAALLAEIDGFESLGRVAVVSATNRVDLLDPALLSRLGEVQIQVGRPGMQAAREIFSVHLRASVPMDPGGSRAAATRQEVIETAASLIYAPNAQNEICELQLRDGELRSVDARDLISGRAIEQIATDARFRAFVRECRGGSPGVSLRDMTAAVDCALDRLSATITVHNARDHLADLPEDVPVARVTSLRGRLAEPSRFWSTP